MKIAFILCGICACLALAGCAVSETSTEEVGHQFQRGIQGQGRIVPNDPTTDSFGNEYR